MLVFAPVSGSGSPSLRRRLLILLAMLSVPAVFGLALLRAYLPWITPAGEGRWRIGPLARFPKGRATLLRRAGAIVVHDDQGVRALSATCTHQRCTVRPRNARGEIACPCHGATFDFRGNVTRPPANQPLPWLALEEEAGELILDTTREVRRA